MKVKSEREVPQLYPTLSDPMDCSPPGSSVHGIFQARVLEWGATAQFPGILLPQSDRHISAPAHASAHHPVPGATVLSVKQKAPPTPASRSWMPRSELWAREQALGALASVRMKPRRAGLISVYLRSVPQRRRRHRHRTRWAERGRPSVPEGPGTSVSRPPCR